MSQLGNRKMMRTITLEEHYASPAFMEGPGRDLKGYIELVEQLSYCCRHLVERRKRRGRRIVGAGHHHQVAAVDLRLVVLGHVDDGDEHPSAAPDGNADAGFAALPTAAPDTAADELERMVREHGFKGALINGHTRGRYLDDKFFWPILERAEALQVPLYLHPTPPPRPVVEASYAGFAPEVTARLASGSWGWHIETAIHVLRLILGGAFDRYPSLQLVIGHLGEALPFMLPRIDFTFVQPLSVRLTKSIVGLDPNSRQNANT